MWVAPTSSNIITSMRTYYYGLYKELLESKAMDTILVVVDQLTKYVNFYAIAITVATQFVKEIVKRHRFPTYIVSDLDKVFISIFWKEHFRLHLQQAQFLRNTAFHLHMDNLTLSIKLWKLIHVELLMSNHRNRELGSSRRNFVITLPLTFPLKCLCYNRRNTELGSIRQNFVITLPLTFSLKCLWSSF